MYKRKRLRRTLLGMVMLWMVLGEVDKKYSVELPPKPPKPVLYHGTTGRPNETPAQREQQDHSI